MANRPWSEGENADLARLHADGLSLREIARQMSRSKDTVSRRAAESGLLFSREGTAAATQAAKADAKARRAALSLAMLADLEEARKRIGAAETAREFQATAQGLDALMRSYINLLRTEPDDGGLTAAQGIVGVILAAIQGSVEGVPRLNPTLHVAAIDR